MAEALQPVLSGKSDNLIAAIYTGTVEESLYRSPMVPESYQSPYNSDDLYKKSGDYSIYEEMIEDDQVSICLKLKKDLVLGNGFNFISDEDGQEEIIEDLSAAFKEDCEIPFLEQIEEILTAYEFGFSLTEKIFKFNEESKLRLKILRTRHPNSWLIHQDDFGNITKYEQNTNRGSKDINPKSLIHYVNKRKFQNPYGTSDLRACFRAWFAKKEVVKYYGIFMQSQAKATPVARYDKNAPQQAITDIHNAIKRFQATTALTIPKEIEVDFIESKSNGEAYSKALNIFNMFIGRSLFIPDLLGMSGSETGGGSQALGREQISIFFMHIERRRSALEALINKHIVWPMVVINHGYIDNYPKFKFNPLDDVQAGELAKIWLEAVKGKAFKANEEEINHFRKLVKFPEGEVVIEEPQALPGLLPNGMPGEMPDESADVEAGAENKKEIEDVEQDESNKKATFGKIFNQTPGDYHKKVNFKAIATKLNDYDQSVVNEVAPIVRKMFADIYDQIEKKKILSAQKIDRIDSINLKHLKELKQVLKSSFLGLYKDAQTQAAQELFKAEYKAPITAEKFLEVLEAETFSYVGDYQYKILSKVKTELTAAIKDGRPLSSVIDILDDSGKALSKASIERFARTKHTEVLNKGRLEFFNESGVVAAYQYSAILDDRTSDICDGLHGKIFKAGSEPIPPMHFNCRSTLIPITKYEEFKVSEKAGGQPIDEFISENVGEGFAVK